ncbi:glycosyltransferase [Amycolatopsis sp. NBC_01488]|uniref:glycosyltransferase n=1 Tax=Amycolatopsis sp. NBC_01488 TaxID=2903563 RepID=UPI002E2DEF54|nr:glycosyltransferase [Amycolatopsis sp. NBC_01488]
MTRIVIVSARVGAGHDGAAYALADRLTGHDVEVLDFLDLLPGSLGRRLCGFYHRQLEVVPRSWDWTLAALGTAWGAGLARRAASLACRRLGTALGGAGLAVSTYPLATHALADLRARRTLAAPLAVYLTDPAVHRLCVHPAADLHIAQNHSAAEEARALGAPQVAVAAPLVRPRFRPPADAERGEARKAFGLPGRGRLALVVAGSWGVGDVRETTADVAASGVAVPVVVCGRNSALREHLTAAGHRHVFGWVEDMPRLLHAVDAVVQNAGGLTTSEALASGVPVVTYRCLPGHGRANAAVLDRIGLVPWLHGRGELAAALRTARPIESPAPAADTSTLLEKLMELA